MATIQTIISTGEFDRLLTFYRTVFGATQFLRVPPEGDVFYVGLRIGDSELGLVAEDRGSGEEHQRVAISFDVPDVDALLPVVERAGGTILGPPNDMPWGQRVAHVTDPDGNALNLTRPV